MTPDPQRPSLTIVLPAYNEAERIGPALDELFGWLFRGGPPRSYGRSSAELGDWDVLVVDDGSEDDTADLVEARPEAQSGPDGKPPRLRVLRRPHAGKGGAVTAGVLSAEGDLIVFTDADMATPPDQIPLLVKALVESDVALGSRILQGFQAWRRSRSLQSPQDGRHRLRRRGHLPDSAPWVRIRCGAGDVARYPRLTHAGPAQPGDGRLVGPVPDPAPAPRRAGSRGQSLSQRPRLDLGSRALTRGDRSEPPCWPAAPDERVCLH